MATAAEGFLTRPFVTALNNVLRTVPISPEPPQNPEPFGVTHYTCLPSRSQPATYECKKGYDPTIDDTRYIPNLVTKLAIYNDMDTIKFIYADEVSEKANPEFLSQRYWACYDTLRGLECKEGQFDSAIEEGKVKYISVPTLMPNHEWYIQRRWPQTRIVDTFSDWSSQKPEEPSTKLQ